MKKPAQQMQTAEPSPKADEARLFRPSKLPLEQRRENLFRAIERTQAFLHKRVPPDAAMADIRRRYPAPQFFIEANRHALEQAGLCRTDAFYYSSIPDLARTAISQQWGRKPRLASLSRMKAYLASLYIGVHVECFYLILLDGRGQLIRPVLLQRGEVDRASFYMSQLLSVTLMEGAKYILLAHNHPGGTKRPSREDLNCTLQALNAFVPLNIPMLDHMIVARDTVVSIRQTGLLPDMLWIAAAPRNGLVRNWLNEAGDE